MRTLVSVVSFLLTIVSAIKPKTHLRDVYASSGELTSVFKMEQELVDILAKHKAETQDQLAAIKEYKEEVGIDFFFLLKCYTSSVTPELYSHEQIFAHGNHHLLTKDYSENHDILSKGHIIDLELQTIFFNIDHSKFINVMLFGEMCPCYEASREQDSLRAASKPENVITLEKPRK